MFPPATVRTAETDAINRASRYSYGEATGLTQTVRNYGASLGFAILGTVLITRFRSAITSSLTAQGLPQGAASAEAAKIAQLRSGNQNITAIPAFIRADPPFNRNQTRDFPPLVQPPPSVSLRSASG